MIQELLAHAVCFSRTLTISGQTSTIFETIALYRRKRMSLNASL